GDPAITIPRSHPRIPRSTSPARAYSPVSHRSPHGRRPLSPSPVNARGTTGGRRETPRETTKSDARNLTGRCMFPDHSTSGLPNLRFRRLRWRSQDIVRIVSERLPMTVLSERAPRPARPEFEPVPKSKAELTLFGAFVVIPLLA